MVESQRRTGERESLESRYYISSLDSDAKRLFQATRSHWGHREQCPLGAGPVHP